MKRSESAAGSWKLRGAGLVFGLLALIFYAMSAIPAMAAAFLLGGLCEIAFWVTLLSRPRGGKSDAV